MRHFAGNFVVGMFLWPPPLHVIQSPLLSKEGLSWKRVLRSAAGVV